MEFVRATKLCQSKTLADFWQGCIALVNGAILRRWADQILLACSAVVLILALKEPVLRLGCWWFGYTSHWSKALWFGVIFFGVALASLVLTRLGAIHPRFLVGRMLRYPPVFFAAFLAGFAIAFHQHFLWEWFRSYPRDLIIIVCTASAGAILGLVYDELGDFVRMTGRGSRLTTAVGKSDESILAWILDERPIALPSDDMFDHRLPAQRIAALLLRESPSSVGIIGPLGSGKSSLINLIEHYLSRREDLPARHRKENLKRDIVTCKIDGWGRSSGTVAQKILALAIEAVKSHVDCISIVTLPENYRQAISEARSPAGAILAALLHASHEPIAQLKELDHVLSAAGLRLVIFLEDLDRNTGDEILRDEMPALLDRLRMLRQVSFVLAIGTDRQFSDVLIRICDHVEAVA
jgi:hypothetical protein